MSAQYRMPGSGGNRGTNRIDLLVYFVFPPERGGFLRPGGPRRQRRREPRRKKTIDSQSSSADWRTESTEVSTPDTFTHALPDFESAGSSQATLIDGSARLSGSSGSSAYSAGVLTSLEAARSDEHDRPVCEEVRQVQGTGDHGNSMVSRFKARRFPTLSELRHGSCRAGPSAARL